MVFSKTERWEQKSTEDTRPIYDANYDVVKHKAPGLIIPSPSKTKTKKQILKENHRTANTDIEKRESA